MAVTCGFSARAVADSPGGAELFLVDGATPVDLYDHDRCATSAVAEPVESFGKYLVRVGKGARQSGNCPVRTASSGSGEGEASPAPGRSPADGKALVAVTPR
ncbi:hypothetical protein [Kitasatospora purpeofusca]|uniref:hypothetical protein n=1 Tax=Kitasatospora purpeofusca TaxID=67352 RepID=UPI00365784FC